jgi:hypothetical protein
LDRRGVADSADLARFVSNPEFFGPSRLDERAAISPWQAAPILRRYLAEHPLTVGDYFDVSKHGTLESSPPRPTGARCSVSTPTAAYSRGPMTARMPGHPRFAADRPIQRRAGQSV